MLQISMALAMTRCLTARRGSSPPFPQTGAVLTSEASVQKALSPTRRSRRVKQANAAGGKPLKAASDAVILLRTASLHDLC